MPKQTVVVVGMGFAGYRVFRELSGRFNVVCIDPKDFFEYVPGGAEYITEPELAEKRGLVDFRQNTRLAATLKQGYVTAITSDGTRGEVTLDSGEKVAFDYAVICSGSTNGVYKTSPSAHTSKAQRVAQYENTRDQIKAAGAVVIVGGGTVGVETAAAIAETFPGKPVTLVTSAKRLVDRMDEKAAAYAAAWLEKKGSVKVVYGERIKEWGGVGEMPAEGTLVTDRGTTLSGLVIRCIGMRPATAAFGASLPGAELSPNGALVVEPTLQLASMPNVFAAGDVAATAEEKTANFADFAGLVAASNIKALAAGNAKDKLQTFPTGLFGGHAKMPILSGGTLGKNDGFMQMGGDVQTGSSTVFMHNFFGGLITSAVAGSWFKGWLLSFIRSMFAGQIKSLAKKASQV